MIGRMGKAVWVVLQTLFFMVLYAAIRRLGRRWWVAGAGLAIVFLIFALAVAPVFIAPLFNKFEPLKEGSLRSDILAMAHSKGIPAEEVYEVDASRVRFAQEYARQHGITEETPVAGEAPDGAVSR